MLALKWLLMAVGFALFGTAAGVVAYDVYLAMQFQRLMGSGEPGAGGEAGLPAGQAGSRRLLFGRAPGGARTPRWSLAAKLFGWGWIPVLLAFSIAVVPEGSGGVRISQLSGVLPGTLSPGVHLVLPFVERIEDYDLRDHLYTTN